ncbi:MAG: hypothetical protein IH891_03630 [Planctomycetes bacterium]|nr:hypothetical protein [Planctomycetota bacterium]
MGSASIFFEARDLRRIGRIFSLNDEQQAVLQEAYLAYGRRKTALETDIPQGVRNRYGRQPPLPAKLRDRLRQADEIILAAITRQLEDESDVRKVDWLRNAQRRSRLGRRGSSGGAGGLDIVLFILDSGMAVEEIETLSPFIDEYDAKATGVYERLFATYASHYEWFLENPESRGLGPHQYDLWEVQSEIARLNADTMDIIGEQLDSDEGTAMLELFRRYCYFPVFDDPDRTHPILNRASRIEDLSASQRESLLNLRVLFLEEYERLTDAMLDDAKYTLSWSYGTMVNRRENPSDNRDAYKRHRFLRDELNAATLVKLRTILTTEQVEAMGGLLNN